METTETNKSTPNQGVTQPSSQQVKKTNWTKIGIIALIIAAIALFIVIILIAIKPSISGFFVKQQTIEIYNLTYSLELENGTIISQETENFEKGMVASSLGFLTNKLDKELTNLSKGETRTIVLEAKDAFGEYDYSKVFNYERIKKENRTIEINRTNWIAINDFKETFGEEPKPNKTYELEGAPWPYKVIEKNETHVKISQEPSLNQEIPFGFFVYKVIEITELKIKLKVFGNETVIPTRNGNIEIKLTENEIIYTLTPEIGKEVSLEDLPKARVTGMNSTHLLLDANHPYAGQKVIVKIIVNEIKLAKKTITGSAAKHIEGAPTLQVFIMSYCPYGLQALKGLLPVWEKFQGKANIELRFVSYIMHGTEEEEENNRMICIREEQYQKLLPYLKCFVESGDSLQCIKKVGIDQNKLESCMTSRASKYMEEDRALNEKYGVRGSPTFVLDGKEISLYPRSPQNIATTICNAFKTKPSVCSESFSTENPSPGFGYGTSQASGSCG